EARGRDGRKALVISAFTPRSYRARPPAQQFGSCGSPSDRRRRRQSKCRPRHNRSRAFCAMMRPMKAAPKLAPAPGSDVPARLAETTVKTKVWLERDGAFVIGDGGLRLLLGIIEPGSPLGARRGVPWAYRPRGGFLRPR